MGDACPGFYWRAEGIGASKKTQVKAVKRYRVRVARTALEDLKRLTEFLVQQYPQDAHRSEDTIRDAISVLAKLPMVGRPARQQGDLSLRELLIPFGRSGYVVLYRIGPGALVSILAARHQLEETFH